LQTLAVTGFLQCRLSAASTVLTLLPLNGNLITIAGVPCALPSAGVTVANSGLAANTSYNVYASWSGTAIVPQLSATGHSTDTTTGMEIQTGTPALTLVGKIRTNASAQFVDSITQRFVINWAKSSRSNLSLMRALTASTGAFGLNAYTVMPGSTTLLEFLTWADEAFGFSWDGFGTVNVACDALAMIGLDAGNTDACARVSAVTPTTLTYPLVCSLNANAAEGYHTAEIYVQENTTATFTFTGSATPGLRCVHSGFIRG
jgi:hypothetical protein